MMSLRNLLLLASTMLLPVVIADAGGQECETITTTIPHLGPTISSVTLPTCSGTVTVVVQTPLPTVCPNPWKPSTHSKLHHSKTTSSWETSKVTESKTSTTWGTSKSKETSTTLPTTWYTSATTSTPSWETSKSSSTATSWTTTPTDAPSPTVKPTPSARPGGACLAVNPLCAADGFSIDYYHNPLGGYSNTFGSGLFSNYYIVQRLRPLASARTNQTFFAQDQGPASSAGAVYPNASLSLPEGSGLVYTQFPYIPGYTRETNGGITVDANNYTLVYSGFFKAPSTGTWQICSSADNENDIYFGDGSGFNCLTGKPSNADDPLVMTFGGNFNNQNECATVELVQGAYYPIRSVMGNWQGPSAFNLFMVAPGEDPSTQTGNNDFSGFAYPLECGIFL